MSTYDIGDVVRLRGSFTNSAGTAVDPSSVTLQFNNMRADPNSHTTLVYGVNSVVKASTGEYYHDFDVRSAGHAAALQHGEWSYRWNGTGSNAAAGERTLLFRVRTVGS